MILDKENYESRGPILGLLSFLWSMFSSTKLSPAHDKKTSGRGIPVLLLDADKKMICQTCRKCEVACPTQAIQVLGVEGKNPDSFSLDPLRCSSCMECVDICPTGALGELGKRVTPLHAEAAAALNKDELVELGQR